MCTLVYIIITILFLHLHFTITFRQTTNSAFAHHISSGSPLNMTCISLVIIITVLSLKYAPLSDNPPPPTVLMKTTAQVSLYVKTLTVTSNLCDVSKILYYAAVLCSWSFLLTCYHKSFLSTISIFDCGTWLCST